MAVETVQIVEFDGGIAIVPESETKKVVIPSPPSVNIVPINPRPGYIYITEAVIEKDSAKAEELKAYADANKLVFILPASREVEDMAAAYTFAMRKAGSLNIKKDQIAVKADEASLDLANELVGYLCDEEDADLEDAEIL